MALPSYGHHALLVFWIWCFAALLNLSLAKSQRVLVVDDVHPASGILKARSATTVPLHHPSDGALHSRSPVPEQQPKRLWRRDEKLPFDEASVGIWLGNRAELSALGADFGVFSVRMDNEFAAQKEHMKAELDAEIKGRVSTQSEGASKKATNKALKKQLGGADEEMKRRFSDLMTQALENAETELNHKYVYSKYIRYMALVTWKRSLNKDMLERRTAHPLKFKPKIPDAHVFDRLDSVYPRRMSPFERRFTYDFWTDLSVYMPKVSFEEFYRAKMDATTKLDYLKRTITTPGKGHGEQTVEGRIALEFEKYRKGRPEVLKHIATICAWHAEYPRFDKDVMNLGEVFSSFVKRMDVEISAFEDVSKKQSELEETAKSRQQDLLQAEESSKNKQEKKKQRQKDKKAKKRESDKQKAILQDGMKGFNPDQRTSRMHGTKSTQNMMQGLVGTGAAGDPSTSKGVESEGKDLLPGLGRSTSTGKTTAANPAYFPDQLRIAPPQRPGVKPSKRAVSLHVYGEYKRLAAQFGIQTAPSPSRAAFASADDVSQAIGQMTQKPAAVKSRQSVDVRLDACRHAVWLRDALADCLVTWGYGLAYFGKPDWQAEELPRVEIDLSPPGKT